MSTVYDELPYPGAPFAQTHPDRLATLATLYGMTPPAVERCRVLELGCGDGGNLIPMAFQLPGARFTGIDLAASAIARGHALIHQLALTNIRVQHLDLMDLGSDFGEFDYIIAHGLYSWVPPPVCEKILAVCKSHLAADGVAFVSYNTYPGGHLRNMIREMMQFHTRNTAGIRDKLRQARELLEFLVEAHPQNDVYSQFLRAEIQSLLERKPEYFFHDELSEYNFRFYFHEFVEHASRHGLQYLAESRLSSMQTDSYPADVVEHLRVFSRDDDVARQQYLDFLKLRNFRQSLLCHSEVRLHRQPDPQPVVRMSAVCEARAAAPEMDVRSDEAQQFQHPKGQKITTNHPLAKAAILHAGRLWPHAVRFPDLLEAARARTGRAASSVPLDEDSNWLSGMLLRLFAANFVELHLCPPVFAGHASDRPLVSALARAQAQCGSTVTNLRHASVEIEDEAARQLLFLLDGTRDRPQLLAELRKRAHPGEITEEQLETNLARLVRLALLVA